MTAIAWKAPTLTDAVTIDVTSGRQDLRLDDAKDYLLRIQEPLRGTGGLIIAGGRNVVLVGGELDVPDSVSSNTLLRRALYLKDQTGVVHVEGVYLGGANLAEGIDLSQSKGAIVQLQNILVDTVHGTKDTNHADVLQAWAGPRILRINRFVGSTTYQGMFLLPHQHLLARVDPWDFRNVEITGTHDSGYMFWKEQFHEIKCTNVHARRQGWPSSSYKLAWPSNVVWPGLAYSEKPKKTFVGTPGMNYRSPAS